MYCKFPTIHQLTHLYQVGVNTGTISDVASPFGGIKESGQGREVCSLCFMEKDNAD